MAKRRLYDEPLVCISVRVPNETADAVRSLARDLGLDISDVLRMTVFDLVETRRARTR